MWNIYNIMYAKHHHKWDIIVANTARRGVPDFEGLSCKMIVYPAFRKQPRLSRKL